MQRTFEATLARKADPEKIRVVLVGLGPIGVETGKLAWHKPGVEMVAAVDIDPDKAGRDLGELLGVERLGITIQNDLAATLAKTKADVVIQTTGSRFTAIYPQLEAMVKAGMNVVSTSEELTYPWLADAKLADKLDQLAERHGVSILGTGINPGFLMDLLPTLLTAPCQQVEEVEAVRIVDVGTRRGALQRKVGVGLSVAEFEAGVQEGKLAHVGLPESAAFVAARLNMAIDRIEEVVEPVIAERVYQLGDVEVAPGQVLGARNKVQALRGGQAVIRLHLQIALGSENPRDEVRIKGIPDIDMVIRGGVAGDQATAAMVINWLPGVIAAAPGLRTAWEVNCPAVVPG
jgi:4-hydroxy-tetrahydrodipicolinate reductase